jgi:hypothetical protein
MAVDRKYERDIDLLLAEEFAVSDTFATWFLNQTRFAGKRARVAADVRQYLSLIARLRAPPALA